MNEPHVDDLIRTVAAMVAANAIFGHLTPEWENYPDIGEHDWAKVLGSVNRLAATIAPGLRAYLAAYEALTARAEAEADLELARTHPETS